MVSGSSSRKSFFKRKDVMHGENIFLHIEVYNEFIQRHSYVDETHLHFPLIISEPTSTNLMESQSQNIPYHNSVHIEILNDGGDEDVQETCKKFNFFEVHMKNVEKPDGTKIIICNYCSKELKWSKSGYYSTYRRHINSLHPTKARR